MTVPHLPVHDDDDTSGFTRSSRIVARIAGCVLLAVGLCLSLAVIAEAWSLYRDPARVERFSKAIEAGSHLDRALAGAASQGLPPKRPSTSAETAPASGPGFRPSYFAAWVIMILLLLLIGRLSLAAVRSGSDLMLFDPQARRLAQALMRELKRR